MAHFKQVIDFQPMPKRFMVWDKNNLRFFTLQDAYPLCQLSNEESCKICFSLQDLSVLLSEVLYYDNEDDYIIVQSTNLPDKNGKEIFEGSIVRDRSYIIEGRPLTAVIVAHNKIAGFSISKSSASPSNVMLSGGHDYEVIGHILSNPELLEEIE